MTMSHRFLLGFFFAAFLFVLDAMTDRLGAQGAPGNFVIVPDQPDKFPAYIRPTPAYVDAIVLVANTAQTWVPPANTRFAIFSGTCNFWALVGGTATVPGASTSNGTASELNPAAYYFNPVPSVVSLISPTACTVTIAAYLGRVN
jgi:hypothetical protein